MTRIGFIGLGVMGAPMARNLLQAGHQVNAFDLRSEAVQALAGDGAVPSKSAAECAANADVVITMLPKGSHVAAALFGQNGAAAALNSGHVVIDMSTVLPFDTDDIAARCHEMGLKFVDAPVGRSSQHAVEGKLLIMAGAEAAVLDDVKPILALLGDTIIHCGGPGSGARAKLVNNYMSIVSNIVTAESLVMAERCGLNQDVTLEVLRGTTAGQGHLNTTYAAKVLTGDTTPGFMIDLAHKDLLLALEMAARSGSPTTTGAAARPVYEIAQAHGRGRDDWTAMLEIVRQ